MPQLEDPTLASRVDPSVAPYRPGDVIAGKYRVEEVLGCGGMAWVLRATHLQLNMTVALKFLRFEATRETLARFFQEGRAAARMSSDAVTRVLDVDRLADGSPFLVMEYLDGFDLQKLVDEPGWLSVATAVDFGIEACEGLTAVHNAGIVHRDLKPANLFLSRKSSGSLRMKLIDFGISKLTGVTPFTGHERPVTGPLALFGSPVYMAPEQMRSTKNVDARADIWSLGVILYELLGGGRSPFEAPTLPAVCMRVMRDSPEALCAIRPDLPLGLETVVFRCLEKDPSRRYPDAPSLAIALAPYASRRGQLRARHMQHPPPLGRQNEPPPNANVAPLAARPSLPPIPAPPRRTSPSPVPAPAPSLPPILAPPRRTSPSLVPASAPRPPWLARLTWLAVGLSVFAGLLGLAALWGRAEMSWAAPVRASVLPAGVANRMPDSIPSHPVSLVPIEAAASTEHVYTPEELPIAKSPSRAEIPKPALAKPPPVPATRASGRFDPAGF